MDKEGAQGTLKRRKKLPPGDEAILRLLLGFLDFHVQKLAELYHD